MIRRVAQGLRDTLRLLSPAVRADRAYTLGRLRLIDDASARALRGEPWMLTAGYGAGFDERVVEYPWALARIDGDDMLLDVGSTLNNETMIPLVCKRYRRIVFLNPFRDDSHRSRAAGVRYVRADARRPALRNGFALLTCLSTLEHVGCDNTRYGGTAGDGADEGRAAAMRSLRELLRPGGRLLLTVPFGRSEDHGWFRQLDAAALRDAVAAFAPSHQMATYYLHDAGWREVTARDCAGASYGDGVPGARAVACVELVA